MGSEQQFCLRWNNHQSTLISVFDSLLESGTLVDVTLAAEGKFLKAHKVVLSACSQYFQELLSNHRETHPIIILKDVSFQEVKALIDYMYRGEVNVSQEQLSALIKTAESLKIKGLADGGDKKQEKKTVPQTSTSPVPSSVPSQQHTTSSAPSAPILPIEPKVPDVPPLPASPLNVREGSISPVSRKRKKQRRRSGESIESEATSTLSEPPISLPNIPASILPVNTVPSKSLETEEHVDIKKQCVEDVNEPPEQTPHPPLLTPKTEYPDDDSVENITLDDDDDELDMDRSRDMDLDAKPGPSHGGEGPASGQGTGFPPWHVGPDRSGDDVFLPSQDSGSREGQGDVTMGVEYLEWAGTVPHSQTTLRVAVGSPVHTCPNCGRCYKFRSTLKRHLTYECGRARKSFQCSHCDKRVSRLDNLRTHELTHRPVVTTSVEHIGGIPTVNLEAQPYQILPLVSSDGGNEERQDNSPTMPSIVIEKVESVIENNSQPAFILTSLLNQDPLNSSLQDSQSFPP